MIAVDDKYVSHCETHRKKHVETNIRKYQSVNTVTIELAGHFSEFCMRQIAHESYIVKDAIFRQSKLIPFFLLSECIITFIVGIVCSSLAYVIYVVDPVSKIVEYVSVHTLRNMQTRARKR